MRRQAIRRGPTALRIVQLLRRGRMKVEEHHAPGHPHTPGEVLAFLAISAAYAFAGAVVCQALGVLHVFP